MPGPTDEEEIRALVDAYVAAADGGDAEAFGRLFLPTARLTTWPPDGTPGSPHYGAEHIAAIPASLIHRYDSTEHRLGELHLVVAGDGRTALGRLECDAVQTTGGVERLLTIVYEDSYARDDDGRWRFATRDVYVRTMEERPVSG